VLREKEQSQALGDDRKEKGRRRMAYLIHFPAEHVFGRHKKHSKILDLILPSNA